MSSAKKTMLVIATILLVGGAAISFGAFAAAGFNPQNLSTDSRSWASNTYSFEPEAESPHSAIVVKDSGEDIRIEPTDGDAIEITYWTSESKSFAMRDEGGVATVEASHAPYIGIMTIGSFEDHSTVLRVPRSYEGSLEVVYSGGNIDVADLAGLESIGIDTNSGDVNASHLKANQITLHAASGNVTGSSLKATYADATTMSGNLTLKNVEAEETVKADTVSGEQLFEGVSANMLNAKNGSGGIFASNIAADSVLLETTSGDIDGRLNGADSDYVVEATTGSGDVFAPTGNARASKQVIARAMSGNVSVTFSGGGESVKSSEPKSESTLTDAPEAPEAPEAPKAPKAPGA